MKLFARSAAALVSLYFGAFVWWLTTTPIHTLVWCAADLSALARPACKLTVLRWRPTDSDLQALREDASWPRQLLGIDDPELRKALFRRYVDKGLDIDAAEPPVAEQPGVEGRTVLFSAAFDGDADRVRLLLDLGADRHHRSALGLTAADVAEQMKARTGEARYDEVIALLR